MPTVSVIVPNYNHAQFLDKRLTTVLEQTFSDMEVLVLDDASSDSSRDVIERFKGDSRVRTDYRATNSGIPGAQWNRGVHMAQGKYIWIAESDDYAALDLLQTLVQILDDQPDVGLAYCESTVVDEASHELFSGNVWTAQLDPDRWTKFFVNDGRDECARFHVVRNLIPNASAVLFRRCLFEEVGGADESYKVAGDYDLWTRMMMRTHLAFTPRHLNFFRDHGTTVRNKYTKNLRYLEEDYQVLDAIRCAIQVPTSSLELAFDRRLNSWSSLCLHEQPQINWRLNWSIYRRARKSDPAIHRRLAQYWYAHFRGLRPHPNRFYLLQTD